MKKSTGNRCVISYRVSGEKQRDGASLDVQLDDCRRYAAREGWTIVDECKDVKSGLVLTRDGYQRVLELVRSGAVDIVLIWRLDRFGRDDGEGITRCNELDAKGVRIVSVTQGELDPMTRGILFVVAKQESRNTSERVLPNIKARVEQGLWTSRPPFGYRMDATKGPGRLIVDEQEAAIVRQLFARAATGESSYSLCGWLNSLTNPDGTRYLSPEGKWFSEPFIKRLLRAPVYIGMIKWNQRRNSKLDGRYAKDASEVVYVPGQHAAIIEQGVFDAVQAINATHVNYWKGAPTKRLFMLTGLIRCGVCGGGMYGQWNNYSRAKAQRFEEQGKELTSFSYKCCTRGHAMTSGRVLDAHVLEQLTRLPLDAETIKGVRRLLEQQSDSQPDRATELQRARAKHEARRKSLTMFLADGTLEPADYKAAIADVEQAMAVIDKELTAIAPMSNPTALLSEAEAWLRAAGDLATVIEAATIEERTELVAGAIQHVTFTKDTGPVITWHPWAALILEQSARLAAVA